MKKGFQVQRAVSFFLAAVMVLTVLVVAPDTVSAAEKTYRISGSGSRSVTIPDEEAYLVTKNYAWIKFKPKADGYVKFSVSNASEIYTSTYGYWSLFDSKKKQIGTRDMFSTKSENAYGKSITYGVKKNKTYYLRVETAAGAKIKAKFYKVSEKSGSKKSKAKKIAKGKTVKGTIAAASKETDWYKFTLPKTQYVKLSYSGKTNHALKITVYEGKRNIGTLMPTYLSEKTKSTTVVNGVTKKKVKVAAGTTYYVKVERFNEQSSGAYTLKWN